jgi:acyl-CoA synthetase (NDP forming)
LYDFEVEGTHTFVANQVLTHNCIGIYKKDLDMIFFPKKRLKRPPEGFISFITQSGAFGSILLDIMANEGVGVSKFISIGNKVDVDEIDLINYLEKDLSTRCIAIYLESVKDGSEFIKTARKVVKTKPIVCFKAGKTDKGTEAVASHTGSLAGSAAVYSSAFKQAGIIEAKLSEEIFDFSKALANQPVMNDNKIAVVTDGGGFGIVATDMAINCGLELPALESVSVKTLKSFLPPYASVKNPIDITGDATVERYQRTLEAVLKDKNIAGVACIALMQLPTLDDSIIDILKDCKVFGKPIIVCSAGSDFILERNRKIEAYGIPVYPTPERAVKALSILYEYGKILKRENTEKKK